MARPPPGRPLGPCPAARARALDEPADPDELIRRFREQLAGLDPAATTALAHHLVDRFAEPGPFSFRTPPSARRPRRDEVATLRVRVDLRDTRPPLWRRLELASDMPLSELHTVLQIAFGWTDSHLHRCSSGTSIYDQGAEAYLMPFEIDEGEPGVPEDEVRIDELLVDVGDRITYGYDFGDDWTHTVKLEAVLPRAGSVPRAVCTAGRRPAPPEDCGGVDGYEMVNAATNPTHPRHAHALAEVQDSYGADTDLADLTPTPFDIDEINSALAEAVVDGGLPEALTALARALGRAEDKAWLQASIASVPPPELPDEAVVAGAVRPFRWLLDQVGPDGIALTGAGYLPPAQVRAFAAELGITDRLDRHARPRGPDVPRPGVPGSRPAVAARAQYRGRLVLTPAGRALRSDPTALWSHLATHLPTGSGTGGYEQQAGLLLLIGMAAGWDDLDAGIARGLHATGWVIGDGSVTPSDVHTAALGTRTVLEHRGAIERPSGGPDHVTELGLAFARAAIRTWP